jgi:DNA repair photolyase
LNDYNAIGKLVGGNEGSKCNYPFRLDTYGCGCTHDCSYCYAKSLLDFRKLWNPKNPSVGNISKISKEIRKIPKGTVVRLGGMTDCFQPIEKIHRVTYKTIKLLNRRRIHYLIVTKSALIADDEYIQVLDKDLAHIQITVTTLDDELSKTYEKASVPSERVKAILKLQELGYDVQIRISPYIPEYMDVNKLNELGIDRALVEFLRVNTWIQKWFDIDYSEYTVKQNGYRHMPLSLKKQYLQNLKGFKELTLCEDETEAYEYWKQNVNFNKEDCCNLKL